MVSSQELYIAASLQWLLFEERYTPSVHERCMKMHHMCSIPPRLLETNSGLPTRGILAGVNGVFRTLRYMDQTLCRSELLLMLEMPFRNICENTWNDCVTVDVQPFEPVSLKRLRQYTHLTPTEAMERLLNSRADVNWKRLTRARIAQHRH